MARIADYALKNSKRTYIRKKEHRQNVTYNKSGQDAVVLKIHAKQAMQQSVMYHGKKQRRSHNEVEDNAKACSTEQTKPARNAKLKENALTGTE